MLQVRRPTEQVAAVNGFRHAVTCHVDLAVMMFVGMSGGIAFQAVRHRWVSVGIEQVTTCTCHAQCLLTSSCVPRTKMPEP